jgi:hypothetical protein
VEEIYYRNQRRVILTVSITQMKKEKIVYVSSDFFLIREDRILAQRLDFDFFFSVGSFVSDSLDTSGIVDGEGGDCEVGDDEGDDELVGDEERDVVDDDDVADDNVPGLNKRD